MLSRSRYRELINSNSFIEFFGVDKDDEVFSTKERKEIVYASCNMFAHGDYYGDSVNQSNYRILEKRGNCRRIFDVYSFEQMLLPVTGKDFQQSLEYLKAVEDYPVLDEDDLTALESELYQEAWESYGIDDFLKEMIKKFSPSGEYTMNDFCDPQDLFERLIMSGEYCVFETGANASICIKTAIAQSEQCDWEELIEKYLIE
jgi:hypothetical protein